jgi:hypothetical protein
MLQTIRRSQSQPSGLKCPHRAPGPMDSRHLVDRKMVKARPCLGPENNRDRIHVM